MTPFIEKLMNANMENTKKAYTLLDIVLGVIQTEYPTNEIRVNEKDERFFMELDENMAIIVGANYHPDNRVLVNVVTGDNNVIAACSIAINGNFEEKFTRFTNPDRKREISDLFTTLSNINVENLDTIVNEVDETETDIVDVESAE